MAGISLRPTATPMLALLMVVAWSLPHAASAFQSTSWDLLKPRSHHDGANASGRYGIPTTIKQDTPLPNRRTPESRVWRPCKLHASSAGYVPPPSLPEETDSETKQKFVYPQMGDLVRFYDVDGGKADGEVLVGRIIFIQKVINTENSWNVELIELEDLGDGYFGDYGMRRRASKKTWRSLEQVAPLVASFVRSEGAYKVPYDKTLRRPLPRQTSYDVDGYQGPFAGSNAIDARIVAADAILYGQLKNKLLKWVTLTGLFGTVVVNLVRGTEDAIIYGAGALASVLYLLLLSIKTDTVGNAANSNNFGARLSNLRFAMPVLVLMGVAIYDASLGGANPMQGKSVFQFITAEQYAAAIIGFLTYRLPLFGVQLSEAFRGNTDVLLPGTASALVSMAQEAAADSTTTTTTASSLSEALASDMPTMLLISGPQATGRAELVQQLLEQDTDGRFVSPLWLDRNKDGASFERLQSRGELLSVDASERYGLTKDAIVQTATKASESNSASGQEAVLVLDADVELTKKLVRIPNLRIVGVWVGLNSVQDFENALSNAIDTGSIIVPPDDTRESIIRGRIKEIIQEIEYGITSGVFEFTIINENAEESLRQLREASKYCFK